MWILNQFAAVLKTNYLPHVTGDPTALHTILDIVFQITGSIALLMIVIGGLRYILARGEPGSVSQAKNTILYAIIGLVITLCAYAIVNLVILRVT